MISASPSRPQTKQPSLAPLMVTDQTSSTQGPSSYAFMFVCQKGPLEGLALLLAASLKRFLNCQYELIAAVPRPGGKWGDLSPVTYQMLHTMGVRIEYFDNPISGEQKGDLLTNKIYCFDIPTIMEKSVFLDSDLLCLQEFAGNSRFSTPFNAAPTFLATGRNWEKIYEVNSVPMPTQLISPLFSDELQPPYFNSGFVAINTALSQSLFNTWLECFNQINSTGVMADNLYFREQVSLSIAVMKLGLDYDVLDKNYNFWVKGHPLNENELPYFLHHTWPYAPIYHQPYLINLVRSLVAEYPKIKPFVEQTRWKYYLRPAWITAINRGLFQHRTWLRKRLGTSLAEAIIAA